MSYTPIFLSGPHGGGKTTLINKLHNSINLFQENDFDIDFTIDFPSIATLSHFERCLMRIYHRFFMAQYAAQLSAAHPTKVILTNRTKYDSAAYIHTYNELGWITPEQFEKLNHVLENFKPEPYAIILNPPLETILERLHHRREQGTRTNRDKIFQNEDSDEFLESLWSYFAQLRDHDKILYLEDNADADVARITSWVKTLPPA